MITKDDLEELRGEQKSLNDRVEYHDEDPAVFRVISSHGAEQHHQWLQAARALQEPHIQMRHDHALCRLKGITTMHFNQPEPSHEL